MMPDSNVEDLMRARTFWKPSAGKFHIWPVAKVEQALRYSLA